MKEELIKLWKEYLTELRRKEGGYLSSDSEINFDKFMSWLMKK